MASTVEVRQKTSIPLGGGAKSPQFVGNLYPFQQKVLEWSLAIDSGILGLDMGLGKTIITLAIICEKKLGHVLIILPLPVMDQWRQAIHKFTDCPISQIGLYQGRTRSALHLNRSIVLTTYDVVRMEMSYPGSPLRQCGPFDGLVLDEVHTIRNTKTQTYACCDQLATSIPNKWLLTGTTIHNQFNDFYNLCQFLRLPGLSRDQFRLTDTRNTGCLEWRDRYYYRLTKDQCQIPLPKKTQQDHILEFDEDHRGEYMELYLEVKELYQMYLTESSQINFNSLLTKILRLRQLCNHPDASLSPEQFQIPGNRYQGAPSAKFELIRQLIQDLPVDDQMIIFSQWGHSLQLLGTYLKESGISFLEYNGSLDIGHRNLILKRFEETTKGKAKVLLITLASGGVGLNLTCANHVVILDSWWNPAMEEQAINRIHRIGQTKPVSVHRLYMSDSIEDWLRQMKVEKTKVADQFHANSLIYQVDQGLLTSLLHRYI